MGTTHTIAARGFCRGRSEELCVTRASRTRKLSFPGAAVDWETVRADLVSDQEADEQQTRSAKRG
jgi:hypothetical protein